MNRRLPARCRGATPAVAVGDALGAPLEGLRTVQEADLERLPASLCYADRTQHDPEGAESLVEWRGDARGAPPALPVATFGGAPQSEPSEA